MTTPPFPSQKKNPRGWTSKDDALLDKAIKKALPPSKVLEDLAQGGGSVPLVQRDNKHDPHPLNRSSRARQKKV